jgi:transmembrane 9 superfamily protein 2/4
MLLCVLVGTGIQLFAMLLITLISGCIGFIYPGKRGSLLTLILLLFVFMGGLAGYWSARFYKMFLQMEWLKNSLLTAFLYPSLAFSIFFMINLFLSFEGSSGAVPFTTILALLVLWLCCSSPLVLIGAFVGMKKKQIENPGKINAVPSSIPKQPWYLDLKIICLFSGILPFG